jgi:hypothetical protein
LAASPTPCDRSQSPSPGVWSNIDNLSSIARSVDSIACRHPAAAPGDLTRSSRRTSQQAQRLATVTLVRLTWIVGAPSPAGVEPAAAIRAMMSRPLVTLPNGVYEGASGLSL